MSTPCEPEDQNDDLLAAYRRASAVDARGPDPRVRERVLAQVRRDHAPAAANDSHWSWRVAAGIAVVGLVGLLATANYRSARQRTVDAPQQTVVVANDAAARVADATPLAAPPLAATPESTVASAPARRRMAAPRTTDSGLAADKTPANSEYRAATRTASMDREDQVRRAVTARFAELFVSVESLRFNLVIALMNSRGQIDRAIVESVTASDIAAASEIVSGRFQKLNLPADQIGASGFIRLIDRSALTDEADRVLLVQYAWPRDTGR